MAQSADTIFTRSADQWVPGDMSMGPFGGLHGGVVSGLLVGELEQRAAAEGWGRAVSAKVYLVRPTQPAPLDTRSEAVREGARLSVWENAIWQSDKIQAKASVCFLKEIALDGMPALADASAHEDKAAAIAALPAWSFEPDKTKPGLNQLRTYLHAVDVRTGAGAEAGMVWVRPERHLLGPDTPLGTAISIADFATLFAVVQDGKPPISGWPNADISVHLTRPPVGAWIGVKPWSAWYANGTGLTEAELHDVAGRFGRSCQSVVLLP